MLQAIRDRVTGIIAWVIVGLLAFVFALWGIDWYLKGDSKIYAAEVNGVEISLQDYRFGMQQQVNRMRAMFGSQFDRSIVNTDEFKEGVLNRLVEEELLVQAAQNAGLAISDAFLAARIQSMNEFKDGEEFSPEKYKRLLNQQGLSPSVFETEMRRSLLISQYLNGISATAIVTDPTVDQGLRLQGQTRDIRFIRLSAIQRMAGVEVDDAAIKDYYEQHKDRYIEPEQVRLAYLELDIDKLAQDVEVSADEVAVMYEREKAALMQDEQRRARHILIQVPQDADEDTQAAAEAKAEKLIAELKAGADFAELARAESDDPGSAQQGGDLGYFSRGAMVPEFDQAVFSMKEGGITDAPVKTSFGLHIIQLTDIKAGKVKPLEEVRDRLAKQIARDAAEERFYELSDLLGRYTFEAPDTLEAAARETGLEIKYSDWTTAQGGKGITGYPNVVEAAFSEDVLESGNNSQVLELAPMHVVVVRVAEHKAAEQLPLETVREAVRSSLQREKAMAQVKEEGSAMLKAIQDGESMQKLANEHDAKLMTVKGLSRNDTKQDRQIIAEAFRAPRRADGQPGIHGVEANNGDYLIIAVDKVTDANTSRVSDADRLGFRRSLTQLLGQVENQALLESLRSKADIQLNLDAVR